MASAAAVSDIGMSPKAQHFDVLVVGAGLSGICAGYYLQKDCPGKTFAILEARQSLGGTWDLFRYPGIRSDSDLYTFGFSFRPWREEKSIAEGGLILNYLRETAVEYGIDRKIRYGHKVTRASWNSSDMRWTLDVDRDGGAPARYTCNFLHLCAGYYDFDAGYMPGWPGMERFRGRIVHPQKWPEDLDYQGRRVVVIGSGATAVTLVPAMAEKAAHVTMLQRSPTYIVSLPARDRIANWLRRKLPERMAFALARWKNVLISMFFYNLARHRPERMKKMIRDGAKAALGPDYDIDRHLTPRYNPWDQRLCLIPDGDMFKAIREGRASIVTDTIKTFTETGIELASGERLDADIIVTATGLQLKLMGGMDLAVDGASIDLSKRFLYKGMMLSDVPNMAYSLGYTNASWTLKCELTARYVCRVLNHMDARGFTAATPRVQGDIGQEPAIDFTSGYIRRALASLPKQGARKPWRLYQNYLLDTLALKFGAVDDGTLEFNRPSAQQRRAA
jgi:cation diffusion facilitator CzcD-associated flavoprotein CzcO